MRHVAVALAAIVLSASFLGCPLLKKKRAEANEDSEDPTAALADAATVKVKGTGAKNEDQVVRYEKETPLQNEPAVIAADGVVARIFPGNGTPVAPLPKGTPVTKIARYFSTAVLVSFDDPSGDGSKLIGWVPPKAFEATSASTSTAVVPTTRPPPPRPTPPQPPRPSARDAGSEPVVVDAGGGSSPVVDAGGGRGGGLVRVVDAGGGRGGGNPSTDKIPQPPRGVQAVPPVDGKCPDGWTIAQSMCRRKCNTDADCDRGISCAVKSGVKVCTSDH